MFHDDSQKDIILDCSSNKYDVFNVLGTFSFGTLSRSILSVVDTISAGGDRVIVSVDQ